MLQTSDINQFLILSDGMLSEVISNTIAQGAEWDGVTTDHPCDSKRVVILSDVMISGFDCK